MHRARTHDGDLVAVKVQYPGMDRAIENDLKSLDLLEAIMAPLARKLHTRKALDELRAVFLAELDYAREAEMADLFRQLNANDPSVVIPRVYHSLTTRRVLTLEYIDGQSYADFCATADQSDEERAGQTIFRFTFRSMLLYGLLYADPHPGNYRFLANGRVGFLDFGCVETACRPGWWPE